MIQSPLQTADQELVSRCLASFQRDMRRHIQCFEAKAG
jgi:hypothetical protein